MIKEIGDALITVIGWMKEFIKEATSWGWIEPSETVVFTLVTCIFRKFLKSRR